jgi:hypothetical protein
MFAAQTNHEEPIGFINPPGNEWQMRKSFRANDNCGLVEYMSFIIFSHTQLEFRPQIIYVIRVKTYKDQYFLLGMGMCFASPMPLTALAV